MISKARLNELLQILDAPGFVPCTWVIRSGDVPYPTYDPYLLVAVSEVGGGTEPYPFSDETKLDNADREEIQRYFAFCSRQERFGDGSIAAEFEQGRILTALHRLVTLLDG